MTKIKICGITNLDDALFVIRLGVDALGFIFAAESLRQVCPETAREIIGQLPPFITTVGVFVNQGLEYIQNLREFCRLDVVQLQGEETPEFCRLLEGRIIKAIRVRDAESLSVMQDYQVNAFLLDTYQAGQSGGTGKTFDWRLAVQAKEYGTIILSGGLNPQNVREAIGQVQPYAVDTASGVEISPGVKDWKKLEEFVAACGSVKSFMKERD
ncbi:MAG: phosphoribosylanthranilate isomerase [Candidatus Schekmanbacteria bacterium]|nr:phosphoribosylanthranilate isomerase [Candidatus Schekmanbacteria bacterium]